MSDLKLCPFCGCSEELEYGYGTDDREGKPSWIYCGSCGAQGPWVYTNSPEIESPEVQREWNRRADIPWLPKELVERLRSAIRKDGDELVLVMHPSACGNLFRDILAACEGDK